MTDVQPARWGGEGPSRSMHLPNHHDVHFKYLTCQSCLNRARKNRKMKDLSSIYHAPIQLLQYMKKNQTQILPRSNSKLGQNECNIFLFHSCIHSSFHYTAAMCQSSQYLLLFLVAKTLSLPVRISQPTRTQTAIHAK